MSDLATVDGSALPQPDISHEFVYVQHDWLYYRKNYQYDLENDTLLSNNHNNTSYVIIDQHAQKWRVFLL